MNRIVLTGIGGLVLAAGTASAAFVGVDIREDKDLSGVAGLPGDLRTFNIYATFDGNEFEDAVLNVGQSDAEASWGINTDLHAGASFFQVGPPFGGNFAPDSGFFGFEETLPADTFVTLGAKTSDSVPNYTVSADPDFQMLDTEIRGGWFNSSPPNRIGEGTFNPDTGVYETLLAQVSIEGLEAGASLGESGGTTGIGTAETDTVWFGEILTGEFFIFTQDPDGGALTNFVSFDIPTPGAAALFGIAGLAGVRRRRA